MTVIIHATVTVTGEKDALGPCEARLRRLLSSQFLKDEVSEHHGPEALCYDLKVEGGIPFPLFAQASQEFPSLTFSAEWVNVAAGEKGRATLANGRVATQQGERLAVHAGDGHPVHVQVAPGGRLVLALTLFRVSRGEWRGYALSASRDALLRVVREPEADAVEIYATEGGAEWALAWHGNAGAGRFDLERLEPPVAIGEAEYGELERAVRQFVSDWIWFASERREDIAVESERYARYGYPVSGANVRSVRLHRMREDAGEGNPLVHSTLGAEDLWVKDIVLATWATESVIRDS